MTKKNNDQIDKLEFFANFEENIKLAVLST